MKVAILSQYYPPVENACANRIVAMARAFRDAGHQLTVVTGMPNYPTGVKPRRYRWRPLVRERIDDIPVVRTYEFAAANAGTVPRLLNYGSFALSALGSAALLDRLDCLVVTSPPLFTTFAARWLKTLRAKHIVCDIRDVWPRSLVEIGHASETSLSIRWLLQWERAIYRQSTAMVATTRSAQAYLEEYCQREFGQARPVIFAPNGISLDFTVTPSPISIPDDRFVLLYSGNFSAAQDLLQFFDFADRLRNEGGALRRVHFLFVGDGELRTQMERHVRDRQLDNVQLAPWSPREQVLDMIHRSTACLVSLKDVPLFREVLPSKTFEYMYFEKAILSNVGGEMRLLLDTADCGLHFQSHDYESFKSALNRATSDAAELRRKGRMGKQHVLAHYQREIIMKRLVDQIEEVLTPAND